MATTTLLSRLRLTTPSPTRLRPRTTCHATRRSACLGIGLGLGLGVALQQHGGGGALAGDDEPANNGWWLTEFPLPVRKIANRELDGEGTGRRSFVRNGIYIADIGESFAAHAYRLRSTAFDLLALEDLLGKDASNYVAKYLRLKSTFMYYDFDMLLSAAAADDRPPLLALATRLFDSFDALLQALTRKDDPEIASCYATTKLLLQEVMATMA